MCLLNPKSKHDCSMPAWIYQELSWQECLEVKNNRIRITIRSITNIHTRERFLAGGYDAIFCIVLSKEAKENVRKLWTGWTEMNVSSLLAQADDKGAMQVSIDTVKELEYRFR